jgi:hypothetical protein
MSKRFYVLLFLATAFISSIASAHDKVTLNDIELCQAIDLSADLSVEADLYLATQPIYERVTDKPASAGRGITLNQLYSFEGQVTERFVILGSASTQERLNLVKAINQSLVLQGASYQCIQDLRP